MPELEFVTPSQTKTSVASSFQKKLSKAMEEVKRKEKEKAALKEAMMQRPLLKAPPDSSKLKEMVQSLDLEGEGPDKSTSHRTRVIQGFLSKLLKIPEDEIEEDHEELVEILGMNSDQMVEQLEKRVSKVVVDAYYKDVLTPQKEKKSAKSIFGRRLAADKIKIKEILTELLPKMMQNDAERRLRVSEVKLLFSKLFQVAEEDIPDAHPDLELFVGSSATTAVDLMHETFSAAQVSRYYQRLFPDRIEKEPLVISMLKGDKLNKKCTVSAISDTNPASASNTSATSFEQSVRRRHSLSYKPPEKAARSTEDLQLNVLGFS